MNTQTIHQLPVSDLTVRPQVRSAIDEETLAGLAQSIRENGVIHPILVYRAEDGALVIVDGHRRVLAAQLAGCKEVPVVILDRALNKPEAIQLQLVSNCQRVDLTPMEKARAIDLLMREMKWTAAQVALKLGVSQANISRSLALLVLPSDVQVHVESGRLAPSTAAALASIVDAGVRQRLIQEALDQHLTREAVTAKAKALATPPKPSKPRSPAVRRRTRVVFPMGEGVSIVVAGEELTPDSVASRLAHLLARVNYAVAHGMSLQELSASATSEAAVITPEARAA